MTSMRFSCAEVIGLWVGLIEEQPAQVALRDQIKPGDRIAIKKMLGKGSTEIEIRALGVVTELDFDDKKVYVDWLVKDLKRKVASGGAFKSIHGPMKLDDIWVKNIFCL